MNDIFLFIHCIFISCRFWFWHKNAYLQHVYFTFFQKYWRESGRNFKTSRNLCWQSIRTGNNMGIFFFKCKWMTACWKASLVPGRCGSNLKKNGIFENMLWIKFMGISCEIALRWKPQITFDDYSTLVLVMARCLTAPSHYRSQWWLRSMSPYCITRPYWVKP